MRPPIGRWGITANLIPLEGGHRNRAFRTDGIGAGQERVFKSTRRSEVALHWLSAVQDIAQEVGFVVPKLIASQADNLVEDGWTCEPFAEGAHLSTAELPSILPQITAFHTATGEISQRPGFLSSQDLIARDWGGDVDLRAMPPDLVARCRDAWAAAFGQRQVIIHGDLNARNLIRQPDGRVALIDWDECRSDLALFDLAVLREPTEAERLACLAWEVACSWQIEPEYARQLASTL